MKYIASYYNFYGHETTVILDDLVIDGKEYTFNCVSAEPLVINTYGRRFDSILTSDAQLGIAITTAEDEEKLYELIGKQLRATIYSDGYAVWRGATHQRFFRVPYEQRPYDVTIQLTDTLLMLKDYQPIMIDFSEPYDVHRYTLLEVLQKALTIPTAYTGIDEVYFYSNRQPNGLTSYIDELTLDPLVFQKDGSDLLEYDSWYNILKQILDVLLLRLVQDKDKFFLFSIDTYKDGHPKEFIRYDLNTGSQSGSITYDPVYIRPFSAADCEVIPGATLDWDPSTREMVYQYNYQPNKLIVPSFTNRSGYFFNGQDGISLEADVDAPGHLNPTRFGGHTELGTGQDNSGRLLCRANDSEFKAWGSNLGFVDVDYQFINFKFSTIRRNTYPSGSPINKPYNVPLTWVLKVRWTDSGGTEHSRTLQQDTEEDWVWSDDGFYAQNTVILEGKQDFEFRANRPETDGYDHYFNFEFTVDNIGSTALFYWLEAVQLQLENEEADTTPLQKTERIFVTDDGVKSPPSFNFKWGIISDDMPNKHCIHLSAPLDSEGQPILTFIGEDGATGSAIKLHKDFYTSQYKQPAALLNFTLQEEGSIGPLYLVQDVENRVYRIDKIKYSDMYAEYTITASQMFNTTPTVTFCDFDRNSFSNDFCITK